MTKWFSFYPDKTHWFDKEFEEYFDAREDVFSSWLKTSYEVTVNNQKIWKIEAVVSDSKAEFQITFSDGWTYPAGNIDCFCSSDLLYGFYERIYNPDKFTTK